MSSETDIDTETSPVLAQWTDRSPPDPAWCVEPSWDEILTDPLIRLVMKQDGLAALCTPRRPGCDLKEVAR